MKKIILIVYITAAFYTPIKAQQQNQLKAVTDINTVYSGISLQDFYLSKNKALLLSPSPEKDYDFYLHRSKNQRIAGWVTLGGGLLLSGIGVLFANGDYATTSSSAAGVFTVAGAVSGIVSIPFMIMASANKHKAKALLNTQKTGLGLPPGVSKSIVGITIQIPLGS